MAVEDAGGKVLGKPVDIVVADHQSKPDVGATIARQWFDADKVDLAIGFDNSSVALAAEQVATDPSGSRSLRVHGAPALQIDPVEPPLLLRFVWHPRYQPLPHRARPRVSRRRL
jgi:hypothetical protein